MPLKLLLKKFKVPETKYGQVLTSIQKFSSPPDPTKMPLASKQLVSFQNWQWIYILLMTVWTSTMKTIMLCYQEPHDHDGIILWYCFLQHVAGTMTENLIEAYSQLSENKLQPIFFKTAFWNLWMPSELLAADWWKPKNLWASNIFSQSSTAAWMLPMKRISCLCHVFIHLTIKLEVRRKRYLFYSFLIINNLGCWTRWDNPQILVLNATINNLQCQLSSVTKHYGSLEALIVKTTSTTPDKSPKCKNLLPVRMAILKSLISKVTPRSGVTSASMALGITHMLHLNIKPELEIGTATTSHHHLIVTPPFRHHRQT